MRGFHARLLLAGWVAWAAASVFLPTAASAQTCADKQPPAGFTKINSTCMPQADCKASAGSNAYSVGEQLGCTDENYCCLVFTATPQAAPPSAGTGGPRLKLPPCIQSGDCGLEDIVLTGASFANLLTELSAALFFATFIYGGAMYLLSFGRSEWVSKGTKAMTGAMIGMGIVLAAWTIVRYIVISITPAG